MHWQLSVNTRTWLALHAMLYGNLHPRIPGVHRPAPRVEGYQHRKVAAHGLVTLLAPSFMSSTGVEHWNTSYQSEGMNDIFTACIYISQHNITQYSVVVPSHKI